MAGLPFPAEALAAIEIYDEEGEITRQIFLGGPRRQNSIELDGAIRLPRQKRSEFGEVDIGIRLVDQHLLLNLRPFSGKEWVTWGVVNPGEGLDVVSHPSYLVHDGPRIAVCYGNPNRTRQSGFLVGMAGDKPIGSRIKLE